MLGTASRGRPSPTPSPLSGGSSGASRVCSCRGDRPRRENSAPRSATASPTRSAMPPNGQSRAKTPPSKPSIIPTSRRSEATSSPSWRPTTLPNTSRRYAGGRPSRQSATLGRTTPPSSRSTRTTSSRDHTPSLRWFHARNQCHARFQAICLGPARLCGRLRRHLRPCRGPWHVDETYVRVGGEWRYLYRAVDGTGQTIDFLLSAKRDKRRPSASSARCSAGRTPATRAPS